MDNKKILNKNLPVQYKYLVDKENRNETDTLEIAVNNGKETLTDKSIIIRDEKAGNIFMLFENYKEFAECYPENSEHLVHEYILSWQKQKPKFDIDKCSADIIEEIVAEIHDTFEETYNVVPDIKLCSSSNEDIKSAHIIITNHCFVNTLEADWFTREVLFIRLTEEQRQYLDVGVNKPNQSFRTTYSTKNGRKKIPIESDRYETMITNVTGCAELPTLAAPKKIIINKNAKNINTDLSKYIDNTVWIQYKVANNRYDFHRLRASYCDICNREHQHDHMFVCAYENRAIQYCRRNKDKYKILYEIEDDFSELYFGDYIKFLGKFPKYEHITNWVKSNIVFILNGGNSFYITRNLKDKRTHYELIKNIKVIKDIKVDYKNPNYNAADVTSKQFISESLGNIISRLTTQIQYNYAEFIPYSPKETKQNLEGVFNLFTSFKAKYDSDLQINMDFIQPWIDHIHIVLANGNQTISEYIISWLAHIMQNPSKKIGTAILFKSEQGSGKNILFDLINDYIIGDAYSTTVKDIEHLVGRFNSTIEHKLLTVCDEIQNYGGAYKSNDKLKSLITQSKQVVERKGIDAQTINDFNNYVFLTNNEWPIKIESSDRRYVAVEPSSCKIGDTDYFNKLGDLLNDEAGMHIYNWLLSYKININLRVIPNTNLRTQLKMNSVPEPILWLMQVISGNIGNVTCGEILYTGNALHTAFVNWAQAGEYKHNYTERTFLQTINKIVKSKVTRKDGKTIRGYSFTADETLTAVKEYLKTPDLKLEEI